MLAPVPAAPHIIVGRDRPVRLAALAMLLLAAIGVAGVLWLARRGPLVGEIEHDFGVVAVHGRNTTVEHTFALVNESNEPVIVERIDRTCGCTSTSWSPSMVGPGETLAVTVSLGVGGGHRRKHVTIIYEHYDEPGTRTLWVEATGVRTRSLRATRDELPLEPGEPASLTLYEETLDDAEPPAPAIAAPPGVRATFGGWEHVERSRNPVRWRGRMELVLEAGVVLEDGAELVVGEGKNAVRVRLRKTADDADATGSAGVPPASAAQRAPEDRDAGAGTGTEAGAGTGADPDRDPDPDPDPDEGPPADITAPFAR